MLSITKTGSVAGVIAQMRDVPERVIPYAAATALTRTAKAAQGRIVESMSGAFDRPTPYTLRSTFVKTASAKDLTARVAVKDTAGAGTVPEHYLLPEVFGGARRETRSERALRYAGVLGAGQSAVAGQDAPKDLYGNLTRSTYTSIRRAFGAQRLGAIKRTKADKFFVLGKPGAALGIFTRSAGRLVAMLAFTQRTPQYRERLDFAGIAEQAARDTFEAEFTKAVEAMANRGTR